jgi:hypothetical protein
MHVYEMHGVVIRNPELALNKIKEEEGSMLSILFAIKCHQFTF